MVQDDYEILPHKELEYLRHEVEKLKKNPYGDTATGQTLLDSMQDLTLAINKLTDILESANEDMIKEYEKNHLGKVAEQNEKLAQGIVAVGTLVEKVLKPSNQDGFAMLDSFTNRNPGAIPPSFAAMNMQEPQEEQAPPMQQEEPQEQEITFEQEPAMELPMDDIPPPPPK